MNEPLDPGWLASVPQIGRVITGRGPDGSMLAVMRGLVILLGLVAVVSGLGALVMGAGSQEPRIDSVVARIAISGAMGLAVIGISQFGRGGPDLTGPDHLALSVFGITMRRVLCAALLGPAGLAISWLAGDGSYVIFGTGMALLFMAVAGPTSKRLGAFQTEVDEAGSGLSVMEALQRTYR